MTFTDKEFFGINNCASVKGSGHIHFVIYMNILYRRFPVFYLFPSTTHGQYVLRKYKTLQLVYVFIYTY